MSDKPRYRRVIIKISGEALSGAGGFGLSADAIAALVGELLPVAKMGVQIGLVVGAGNFVRGRDLADNPQIRRVTADFMGMTGTIINALALRDTLESQGRSAVVLSAIAMSGVCEAFDSRSAAGHLDDGRVAILAGGTGRPFFTTDSGAALRALELDAEVLMKATKVDGVFDSDPAENPDAVKYDRLSYEKVLADRLGVMDLTAISMCMEADLPVLVFRLTRPGNLAAAVRGEPVGTTISR